MIFRREFRQQIRSVPPSPFMSAVAWTFHRLPVSRTQTGPNQCNFECNGTSVVETCDPAEPHFGIPTDETGYVGSRIGGS